MIPEAAVEAAARQQFDQDSGEAVWGDVREAIRTYYREEVRKVLEAAAPHIRAQALEDAADAWQVRMDTIGRGTVEAKTFMQMRAQADRTAQ